MTTATRPLLVVEDLSKTFPGLQALVDVDFRVDSGEIVALVGQNGSGKSTLVKVLTGIHEPDPGARIAGPAQVGGGAIHVIHQVLERIGAHVVALDELEDLDGRLTAWLDEHGLAAVLARPDTYVFGAAETPDDLPALVDDLRSQLSITDSRITADVH